MHHTDGHAESDAVPINSFSPDEKSIWTHFPVQSPKMNKTVQRRHLLLPTKVSHVPLQFIHTFPCAPEVICPDDFPALWMSPSGA